MNWLGKMIGLPPGFLFSNEHRGGGCIQTSGSESTFMAVLSAKSKKLAIIKSTEKPKHYDEGKIISNFVAYSSCSYTKYD